MLTSSRRRRSSRRAYGQRMLDGGIEVENVSVAMGHSTTKTTEEYYARKRNAKVMDRIFECKNAVQEGA